MFIDSDSVKINDISIGQYATSVKFGYNKLWSSDSGRNLAGVQSGTLVGVFPKLVIEFRPLTKSELNVLAPIFDSTNQTITYYDPSKNSNVTMTTYTGDWELENRGINQNEGFSISFISTSKRS